MSLVEQQPTSPDAVDVTQAPSHSAAPRPILSLALVVFVALVALMSYYVYVLHIHVEQSNAMHVRMRLVPQSAARYNKDAATYQRQSHQTFACPKHGPSCM